ncbi:hypothetical protein BH10BAC2_BH10BAC2_07250 [soil metagenome]
MYTIYFMNRLQDTSPNQAFKIVQINSMVHFAQMHYTVKVSDTRDDDSSNTV